VILSSIASSVDALIAARPPQWSGPQLGGNWDVIWYYARLHIRFTAIALGLGTSAAFLISYVCHRWPATYAPVLAATNVVYAIPSIALFTLLGPALGYTTDEPIVVAMALYTLVILVRNIVEGLRTVAPAITDAAIGLGYRPLRRFVAVDLPLALPGIIAGLRLASVSTISLISVGGAIGKGALGRLFADGVARRIDVEIWSGIVAVVVLALVADALLLALGRVLTPWVSAERRRARRRRRAGLTLAAAS